MNINENNNNLHAKAVFLDADGVLNKAILKNGKPVAPTSITELDIPAEVKPALYKLKEAGFLLICVTNKPDVSRGLMTQAELDKIYDSITKELPLDDVFICYVEGSPCFKPAPGLILDAAQKYQINLGSSFMIGDRWSDIAAGQNAHCKTIWINRHYPNDTIPNPPADFTTFSLTEAVAWILADKI